MEQKIQLVAANPIQADKKDQKIPNNHNSHKGWPLKNYSKPFYTQSGYPGYYQQYMYPFYEPSYAPPPIDITFQQAENHQFYMDFPRAEDYNNFDSIVKAYPHLAKINDPSFDVDGIKECRTFILRSNNEDDVHKAIKYRVWTSTQAMNERIRQAYAECKDKNIPIFLFFSVMRSGQFIGVAELKSTIIDEDFQYWWEPDRWRQKFEIDWLFIKDMPLTQFEKLKSQDGYSIIRAKDGTSIQLREAKQMLKLYKDKKNYRSIFSAFHYMDVREDFLRLYRNPMKYYQEMAQYNNYNYGTNATGKKLDGSSFKYNTFPGQNDQKKESNQNKTLENFKTGVKEFETILNFYENHRHEWGNKIKALDQKLKETNSSNDNYNVIKDSIMKDSENIQGMEVGLTEGLEQLVNKTQNLEKSFQELETINQSNVGRIGVTDTFSEFEKQKNLYNNHLQKFNKFRDDFNQQKNSFNDIILNVKNLIHQ